MSDLIRRDEALDVILNNYRVDDESQNRDMDYVFKGVFRLPVVDAEPVRHGKWIFGGDGIIDCSECNEAYDCRMYPRHYCPNCGAKMDGAEPDDR